MDREPAAVAQPPIAANLHQSLDVEIDLAAEVSLDHKVAIDVVTHPRDLFFGEIPHPGLRLDARSDGDLGAPGAPDAMDVRERDLNLLVVWNVHASDSRQL